MLLRMFGGSALTERIAGLDRDELFSSVSGLIKTLLR